MTIAYLKFQFLWRIHQDLSTTLKKICNKIKEQIKKAKKAINFHCAKCSILYSKEERIIIVGLINSKPRLKDTGFYSGQAWDLSSYTHSS